MWYVDPKLPLPIELDYFYTTACGRWHMTLNHKYPVDSCFDTEIEAKQVLRERANGQVFYGHVWVVYSYTKLPKRLGYYWDKDLNLMDSNSRNRIDDRYAFNTELEAVQRLIDNTKTIFEERKKELCKQS